uniref:Uncharacterized protein n=1 Tax=Knipowitschia caucasica TaxID=637954 RepID=A0AAV2MLX6_KNICA
MYGEEEVCSDRLDSDFPDIDLSQLDPSDFDSVNCLSELQWCSDQQAHASPASIHCSSADQLFQVLPPPPPSPGLTWSHLVLLPWSCSPGPAHLVLLPWSCSPLGLNG